MLVQGQLLGAVQINSKIIAKGIPTGSSGGLKGAVWRDWWDVGDGTGQHEKEHL